MDIYSFFNSSDVAEHCKSIGHEFDAIETAVMVSMSNTKSIQEKLSAYRTIIENYPDMEIPHAYHHERIGSFHEALGGVIAYQERALEKYLTPEPGMIYHATIIVRNPDRTPDELEIYTSHENALADALEYSYSYISDEDFSHVRIKKKYIDCSDTRKYIEAKVSRLGDIIEIDQYGFFDAETETDLYLLDRQIYVPAPFKPGDLVEDDGGGWMGNVYVLRSIDYIDYDTRLTKCGDKSDMTAWVYYESEGSVKCECVHFYPNLRYCRRELEGRARILKYVNLHLQDNLCLCSLLQIQKYLTLEYDMEKAKQHVFVDDLKYRNDNLVDDKASVEIDGVLFNKRKTTLIRFPKDREGNYSIPDGVEKIGDRAFYECTKLESITIPGSVTAIGERAFSNCESLRKITIPDSVATLGDSAFEHCGSLTDTVLSKSLIKIGYGSFSGCSSLTSITIPNGVMVICKYAFEKCKSLASVAIPDSVMIIERKAFSGCTSLADAIIPEGVRTIGVGAFDDCSSLVDDTKA